MAFLGIVLFVLLMILVIVLYVSVDNEKLNQLPLPIIMVAIIIFTIIEVTLLEFILASLNEVQCVRCGCNVEHHFECLCGYDRAVFSEEDWKMDIEGNNWSELKSLDEEFVANGYKKKTKRGA